jgi:hypothetical protein
MISFRKTLLVVTIMTLGAWLVWFLSTPVGTRIAVASLVQWGVIAVPVVTVVMYGVLRLLFRLGIPRDLAPLAVGALFALIGLTPLAYPEIPVETPWLILYGLVTANLVLLGRGRQNEIKPSQAA